jgi:hypothetical protein
MSNLAQDLLTFLASWMVKITGGYSCPQASVAPSGSQVIDGPFMTIENYLTS